MAVEIPTWEYKSEGEKQTASEMNQLAQAVITSATELSNAKDDVATLSNDVTDFDNRLTAIEESETIKKVEEDKPVVPISMAGTWTISGGATSASDNLILKMDTLLTGADLLNGIVLLDIRIQNEQMEI